MTIDTCRNTSSSYFNVNVSGDSFDTQDIQEDTQSFNPKQSNNALQTYHSKEPPSLNAHSPRYEQNSEIKQWEDENKGYKLEIHQSQSQQNVKDLLPRRSNKERPQNYSSIHKNQSSLSSSDSSLKKPYTRKEQNMDQMENKLVEQNKEIQQLLEQRIVLETELAAFRGSKNISSDTTSPCIVDSSSAHHQKLTQIQSDSESHPPVRVKMEESSGVEPEKSVNADIKGKKKSGQKWFSFTRYKKNSKKSNEKNVDLILDDSPKREASSDNLSLVDNDSVTRAKQFKQSDLKPFDVDTSLITSLQKDLAYMTSLNASLQSEIQSLKLELQTRFTQHEFMQSSLGDTDKILLPFPFDKEKTPEQLQLLFEVQSRALEKLSLKNTMLQKMLAREQNPRSLKTSDHDENHDKNSSNQQMIQDEKPIENDIRVTYEETLASLLREKNTVALLEEKVKKLQTLLKEEKQRFSVSVETLKSEITKYSVLSGNLVQKCETTQNELYKEREKHLATTKHYEEKLRRLKNFYSTMSPVQSLTELSLNKVYETSRDAPPNQKASGFQRNHYNLMKENVVNISFIRDDFSSSLPDSLKNVYCDKNQAPVFIEREENGYYLCETLPSRIRPSLKTIASPALIKWATTSEPVIQKSSLPFISSSNANNYKQNSTEYIRMENAQELTVTPVLSNIDIQ